MLKRIVVFFTMLVSAVAFSAGCNQEKLPDGMPELFPLTLNVTQGGEPAEDVLLTFYGDSLAWGVGGKSDAQGKVVVMTQGQYRGVPAGDYTVVASKYYVTPSKYGTMPSDPGLREEWAKNVEAENAPVFLRVAPELLDPATTTLKVSVKEGTPTVDLDLGEKVDIQVDRKTRKILK